VETAVAWKSAILNRKGPTALVLSRQNLPAIARSPEQQLVIGRGAYVLLDCQGPPAAIVIATGSEVSIALDAVAQLQAAGKAVRLVSMPSTSAFDAQSKDYKEQVLPKAVRKRLAVEAGHPDSWYKYVGLDGKVIGMASFGESAPGPVVLKHFGFTADNIKATLEAML
jgi:transketolase